jgi:glutathione peroxidase
MTEKVEVNGAQRHPLYQRLVNTTDAQGKAGDIQWNAVVAAIEGALPANS